MDNLPGFDDVSISYNPPKKSRYGYDVDNEHFQIKFHIAHNNAMTFASLTDPSFIGATSESLLQKLYINYQSSQDNYIRSTYSMVNIWGVDRDDLLYELLDNNGGILIDKLFDGKGVKSKTGSARKQLMDHLGITSENDLKVILRHFRILDNSKGIEATETDMIFALNSIGLKTDGWNKRVNPYPQLIMRLHEEKKNQLTKDALFQILSEEDLWVTTTTQDVSINFVLGLRTFRRGTDSIRLETDHYLCLLHHFKGRYVLDENLWQAEILPALEQLSDIAISQPKPVLLHLDCHISTAFAMGYLMDQKTGVFVSVVQKVFNGNRIIYSPSYTLTSLDGPLWTINQEKINNENEIAISISISRDVNDDVTSYINSNLPSVSNHINFAINPSPGITSIIDGDHVVNCVDELINFLETNFKGNPNRIIHLFISSPNVFAFYLGRHSKVLGKIVLYEFDFEKLKSGTYEPSIQLPII